MGINEFTAKSNYLLGAYGKMLQEAGLDLEREGFDASLEQFSMNYALDQKKFDYMKEQGLDDAAREWAKVTGYYEDESGKIFPTADMMVKQLKATGGGGGGAGGTVGETAGGPPTGLPDISTMITEGRGQGMSDADMRADLAALGYSIEEINAGLSVGMGEPTQTGDFITKAGGVVEEGIKQLPQTFPIAALPAPAQPLAGTWRMINKLMGK